MMSKERQFIDAGRTKSMSEARRIVNQGAFDKAMAKVEKGKTPVSEIMRPYVDKYFTRSRHILEMENLNPWVNIQVFIRKGPGELQGIKESIELLSELGAFRNEECRVYTDLDGSHYGAGQTIMNIVAPVQDIIEWETLYLGIISYRTSVSNGKDFDGYGFENNIKEVVRLVYPRSVLYFGARHWHWQLDNFLSDLAFKNGCIDCSTDNGAKNAGKEGIGTIPHSLENIYAYYYGVENAVVKSTLAFHKYMPKEIPRIALIDYANQELTNTISLMNELGVYLDGVRIDTCGENIMEGINELTYPAEWKVNGVSLAGVAAVSKLFIDTDKQVILSSGFGNPKKVESFLDAEKYLGRKLFDAIGAGFMDNIITATADIVAVGETSYSVDFIGGLPLMENIVHKVGRLPKVNESLKRAI